MTVGNTKLNPLPPSLIHVRRRSESPVEAVDSAIHKAEQHSKGRKLPIIFWFAFSLSFSLFPLFPRLRRRC